MIGLFLWRDRVLNIPPRILSQENLTVGPPLPLSSFPGVGDFLLFVKNFLASHIRLCYFKYGPNEREPSRLGKRKRFRWAYRTGLVTLLDGRNTGGGISPGGKRWSGNNQMGSVCWGRSFSADRGLPCSRHPWTTARPSLASRRQPVEGRSPARATPSPAANSTCPGNSRSL